LPKPIANGWPLNALNPATVYGGAEEGFTDYPEYSGSASNTAKAVLA